MPQIFPSKMPESIIIGANHDGATNRKIDPSYSCSVSIDVRRNTSVVPFEKPIIVAVVVRKVDNYMCFTWSSLVTVHSRLFCGMNPATVRPRVRFQSSQRYDNRERKEKGNMAGFGVGLHTGFLRFCTP